MTKTESIVKSEGVSFWGHLQEWTGLEVQTLSQNDDFWEWFLSSFWFWTPFWRKFTFRERWFWLNLRVEGHFWPTRWVVSKCSVLSKNMVSRSKVILAVHFGVFDLQKWPKNHEKRLKWGSFWRGFGVILTDFNTREGLNSNIDFGSKTEVGEPRGHVPMTKMSDFEGQTLRGPGDWTQWQVVLVWASGSQVAGRVKKWLKWEGFGVSFGGGFGGSESRQRVLPCGCRSEVSGRSQKQWKMSEKVTNFDVKNWCKT